jgi:hypothetical protein
MPKFQVTYRPQKLRCIAPHVRQLRAGRGEPAFVVGLLPSELSTTLYCFSTGNSHKVSSLILLHLFIHHDQGMNMNEQRSIRRTEALARMLGVGLREMDLCYFFPSRRY